MSRGVGLSDGPTSGLAASTAASPAAPPSPPLPTVPLPTPPSAATSTASVGAVVEEEWSNRNISFSSVGEISRTAKVSGEKSGSDLLADILQEGLIHEHYDGVVENQRREREEERKRKKG